MHNKHFLPRNYIGLNALSIDAYSNYMYLNET